MQTKVLILGGGDLGTGVARRLFASGMFVAVTEQPEPRAIRRTVAFASAVFDGEITVDGVRARLCDKLPDAREDCVPVIVDETSACAETWKPEVIINARMLKRPVARTSSPRAFATDRMSVPPEGWLIGLGPGFDAGVNCHAVIETNRGHDLGRVIWQGQAAPNTGIPGEVLGHRGERLLRAPADGLLSSAFTIGDPIRAGQIVAHVGETPLTAAITGVLRGLLQPELAVRSGEKVGDIDPRGIKSYCFTISDKANAVAGGALEAVLALLNGSKP